jgi:hypothetical protein
MDPKMTLIQITGSKMDPAYRRANIVLLAGWLRLGGFAPRVELHPATDAWIMGDRFGAVVKAGWKYATVRCERSGRERLVAWDLLVAV